MRTFLTRDVLNRSAGVPGRPAAVLAVLMSLAVMAAGCSRSTAQAPATRPSAATVAATAPAISPATWPATSAAAASAPARYPSDELAAACQKVQKDVAGKLDAGFNTVLEPPFVIAGNLSQKDLAAFTRSCVTIPAELMWKSYFRAKPDKVITVLLFKDEASYRDWAKKLFGDAEVSHFGYYKPDKRTLVMNIGTGGGTLIHELTHALIVYDFPEVPQWFNEGLASLHEGCRMGEGEIIGLTNWRLKGLKQVIEAGKLRPLSEMLSKDDFYGELKGINYAQSRYLFQYIQSKGLLKKFYDQFRSTHDQPDAAVKAVEHVLGKKIDQVEADYLKYVGTLKYP